MKKIYLITCIAIVFLATGQLKSQNLTTYNLYVQNPVLYNPAHTFDSLKVRAFVNSHVQWTGMDGAPKVNTFGLYGTFKKNMALGINVYNLTHGLLKNTNVNLSYAYKANLGKKGKKANDNYLLFGLSAGALLDNFNNGDIINSNPDDPTIVNNLYNQTTFSTRVGVAYYYKGLEVQFVMPQLFERNDVSTYSLGFLTYDYIINNNWTLKPSVMVRGVSTSPSQYDVNLAGIFKKAVWAQAGYRSNNSYTVGGGVNIKAFEVGYIYQIESNYITPAATGTHEIQLVYRFIKEPEKKELIKLALKGRVKDMATGNYMKANIQVLDNNTEVDKGESDESGNFNAKGTTGKTYIVKATAPGYYDNYELLPATEVDLAKPIEISMIPENAKVLGTIVRRADNKPIAGTVAVLENGKEIKRMQVTDGIFNCDLKSGKTYTFNLTSDNYPSVSQTIDIPAKTATKDVKFFADFISSAKGSVTDHETNNPVNATIAITKNGTPIQTINANGNYTVKLQPGAVYELECKADGYYTKKTLVDLASLDNAIENIQLRPIKKTAFSLGQINFSTDESIITTESLPILDNFVKVLNDNPTMKFEIAGHTDNVGKPELNKKLSLSRAQACIDYMVSKGIAPNRLKPMGYGSTVPLVPNDSPENRYKNRRVEAKIIQ